MKVDQPTDHSPFQQRSIEISQSPTYPTPPASPHPPDTPLPSHTYDKEQINYLRYADQVIFLINPDLPHGRSGLPRRTNYADQILLHRFEIDTEKEPASTKEVSPPWDSSMFIRKNPSGDNPFGSPWTPGEPIASPDVIDAVERPFTTEQLSKLDRPNKAEIVPPPPVIVDLHPQSYIKCGELWDLYRGTLSTPNFPYSTQIIIKIMTPREYEYFGEDEYDPHDDSTPGHTIDTARKAVMNEDYVYRILLPDIQGSLVPLYFGSFAWHTPNKLDRPMMIVHILEDVGNEMYPGTSDIGVISISEREKIYDNYQNIMNNFNILHGAVLPRHLIQSPSGNPKLVDFQIAVSRQGKDKARLDHEDGHIFCLLNCYKDDESGELIFMDYGI